MRQLSPSHSRPVTASGRYPVSCLTVTSAACASSVAESFPSSDAAMALLFPEAADHDQAIEDLILRLLDLLLAQFAPFSGRLQLRQRDEQRGFLVELVL